MKPSASVLLNRLLARGKFRHLQVLLRLAELGSLQRTADAIGITQSAVTQTLAYLERLLETPLFERHARGVRPTPACVNLLPVARQLMMGVADGAQVLAAHHSQGSHTVRLAASSAATTGLLLPCLSGFHEAHPGVEILLGESEGPDQLLAIARGEVDMVACRQPAALPDGWTFHALVEDRYVVVCSSSHRLTRRSRLDWSALAGECWLLTPAGSGARQRFDELASGFAQPPRTHPLITRVLAAMAWTLRTQGVLVLLPFSVVRHLVQAGELAVLPLKDSGSTQPLGLLRPAQAMGQAATLLFEHLLAQHEAP